MNQTPSLRDTLRSSEDGIDNINVFIYEKYKCVSKSDIEAYMESTGVSSKDVVLEDIKYRKNIKSQINIIDTEEYFFESDLELFSFVDQLINEFCILEAINPKDFDGMNMRDIKKEMFFDKLAASILRRNYNEVEEIDMYIKKCNRLKQDIAEERNKAIDFKNNSSYKFTSRFSVNFIKRTIKFLIIPYFVKTERKIYISRMPQFIQVAAGKLGIGPLANKYKKAAPETKKEKEDNKQVKNVSSDKPTVTSNNTLNKLKKLTPDKAMEYATKVVEWYKYIAGSVNDVKMVYLSLADYNAILDGYEKNLDSIIRDLTQKKIELQKGTNTK